MAAGGRSARPAVAAVCPVMVKQGSGHIINTASLLGLDLVPGWSVYSATKHAVVGLSLSLRQEARMLGVKVRVVCPSFIRSNIVENSARILGGTGGAVLVALPPAPVIFFRFQYGFGMRRMGRASESGARGKGFPPARWLFRFLLARVGRE